jgi:putative membrane protein
MGPWMMGAYYGWGWFMPILMVVFWGLIIWGIVALVRYVISSTGKHSPSALDTLKLRYAQGEISKAEYEEKKKALI